MQAKLQPALLGGTFIGVLSALPFVSNLNACCCLWVIAGGVLTSYLLQERSPVAITAGDGAIAGLIAGLAGAVIATVLGSIVGAVTGMTPQAAFDQVLSQGGLPSEMADSLEQLRDIPVSAWILFSFVISLIVYPIFALLGGLLGVAMFKKNTPPPAGTVEVLPPE